MTWGLGWLSEYEEGKGVYVCVCLCVCVCVGGGTSSVSGRKDVSKGPASAGDKRTQQGRTHSLGMSSRFSTTLSHKSTRLLPDLPLEPKYAAVVKMFILSVTASDQGFVPQTRRRRLPMSLS